MQIFFLSNILFKSPFPKIEHTVINDYNKQRKPEPDEFHQTEEKKQVEILFHSV